MAPGAVVLAPTPAAVISASVVVAIAAAIPSQSLYPTPAAVTSVATTPPPGPSRASNWTFRIDVPYYGVQAHLIPDGDGGYSDCAVVGAATNWQAEQDGNDTTYCWSGLPGDTDLFTATALRDDALTVSSVNLILRVRTTASSGTNQFRGLIHVGTDIYRSDPVDVDNVWRQYTISAIACPDGGSWTVAKVNSMKLGYEVEVAASGKAIQFADLLAQVTFAAVTDPEEVANQNVTLNRAGAVTGNLKREYAADAWLQRTAAVDCSLN